MAGLTVASRTALAQVIEAVPDDALDLILTTVARMPGERARELEDMLETMSVDRRRRVQAFDAIIPLFRPRRDGIQALTFPTAVLPRLWRAAADRTPEVLTRLDSVTDEDASRRAMARSRLYSAAAAAVREQPDLIWPSADGASPAETAAREAALVELALCCDMGVLAHRATRGLSDWIARPDEDRLVELKLAARDAAEMDVDGARRLMDIMVAHLDEACRILRLVVHAIGVGGQESMMKLSEMAVVIDRVLDGLELRSGRIAAFRTGGPTGPLGRDLSWCAGVLETMDLVVHADPKGDWARRAGTARSAISDMMDKGLRAAAPAMMRVLPRRSAQTAGRMTRKLPRLDIAVAAQVVDEARQCADLVAVMHPTANRFGCEGLRQTVVKEMTLELLEYAEQTIDLLNAGDAPDPALGVERAGHVADLLERIEAETEARTVRRRIFALTPLQDRPSHAA